MLELRKRADTSGPVVDEYGTVLRTDGDENPPDFTKGERWPLARVELVGDPPAEHGFASSLVNRGLAEGWVSLSAGSLVLHVDGGDVFYRILRAPERGHDEYTCELETEGLEDLEEVSG